MISSSSSSPTIMDRDNNNNIPRFDWDLSFSSVVSSPSTGTDAIGAIEFDPSGEILATGGIARKIRIYRLNSLLGTSRDDGHVERCICTPAKLSSLKWRPDSSGRVIGSGDYDGVVTEYDVERGVPVFERDEHGGRKIWSVDYTLQNSSVLGASGSDDGTVQMWDSRNGGLEETVRPGGGAAAAICSVKFDPFGGHSLAVGCADRNAYVYDIRRLVDPMFVLDGHTKTVTYARFMDQHTMVTGSTDGSVKLWDIANGQRVVRTCRGHVNSRNFVGLSVWRHGGLVVSGSESNEVFVYDKRWGEPVWVRGLGGQTDRLGSDRRFVSSVCWRQADEDWCTLVAGGSDGVLEIFSGIRNQ